MKKLFALAFGMLLLGAGALAQTTSVTATVTDSDGTTWKNGTWAVDFVANPANPYGTYYFNGSIIPPSMIHQSGSINSSGALSFVVDQNASITPVGSSWNLKVCPDAITQCGIFNFTAIGASMDLSAFLTTAIPAPRFHPISGAYGYNDAEAILSLVQGSTYWNVSSSTQRCYTGTAWQDCSGTNTTSPSNGLISGGAVVWTGTGLNFTVSPAVYYIGGVLYTSPQASITLAASDPSNPRLDQFYVSTSSTASVLTGTPSANPSVPSINPTTEIALAAALIPAGATTPAGGGTTTQTPLAIEHNGSTTNIAQNPLNIWDSPSSLSGGSLDAGYQPVIVKTDTIGGWAWETAASSNQFTAFSAPPIAGQYAIAYPTGFTDTCTSSGNNTSGKVNVINGNCVPAVHTWTFSAPGGLITTTSGATIPIANVTAVYPFVISASTIQSGSVPSNTFATTCTGTGFTLSDSKSGISNATLTWPLQQYTAGSSLIVSLANYNAMTCDISANEVDGAVGPPNIINGNATLVGAYIYYTGTPVTAPSNVYVQGPLQYNTSTQTLSLPLPYDVSVDFGASGTTYAIENDNFTSQTSGLKVTFCAANANTSTAPTLNMNGWGAWTIVGPTGGALALNDITPCAGASGTGQMVNVQLTQTSAGMQWWLQNPKVSGISGVSSVSNSDGSLTISPTTGAVVASLNMAHANTFTALQKAKHFQATGTPTIVCGTGAGTSPTVCSIAGTDEAGQISVTTGSAPANSATIATITLANACTTSVYAVVRGSNAASSALSGTTHDYPDGFTASSWTLTSNTTGLAATTAYTWAYIAGCN